MSVRVAPLADVIEIYIPRVARARYSRYVLTTAINHGQAL